MHPSIAIYDDAALQFINTDIQIETLSDDCQFTEGPVWKEEGFYLFSDITANTIYKLVPGSRKEVYLTNSGTENINDEDINPIQAGANGLTLGNSGELLVCRHGSHMVAVEKDHSLQPLINSYKGKPFNSPNDIIVDPSGRIFFSDPPYGLKDGKPAPGKFQPLAGVYCYDNGAITLVCDAYQYPNGVCITPDKKQLYICSNKPTEKFISVYDLSTLKFEKILAKENSDGIKCDPEGNVYLSNKDGIIILSSEGARLALIHFPTIPANHCFGGPTKRDLFITGREKVYRIKDLLRTR